MNEPYHTEALWAAREIAQKTNGRWNIEVFAASALGNEPAINQGLTLGTVDMIYTGVAFAGASYRPMAISHAPYALRDYAHFQAYRASDLHRELVAGYDRQTGHHALALTYYGDRMVTANRSIMQPGDMRGLKLRVPQAPSFLMFARAVGANATPIAFAEVYLALQNGTVDGQENPLPTIQAKKFFEVQSHISLTAPHHRQPADHRRRRDLAAPLGAGQGGLHRGAAPGRRPLRRRDPRAGAGAGRLVPRPGQDGAGARPRRLPRGLRAAAQRECGLDPGAVRPAAGAVARPGRGQARGPVLGHSGIHCTRSRQARMPAWSSTRGGRKTPSVPTISTGSRNPSGCR